ncbi:MAG: Rrf2 family transcriptional regulator [Phycisphaerales bacterium]
MISQTSEYALRAVVHLAKAGGGPAVAQDIAEATQVSVGYLHKILRLLARKGILLAQRGVGGGFSLARPPDHISVLEVLRVTENELARIESCPLGIEGHTQLCPLHRLLDQQIASIERVFDATSIADLLDGSCEPGPPGSTCSQRCRAEAPADTPEAGTN